MDNTPSAGGAPFNQFEVQDREQRDENIRKGRFRLGLLTLFRGLQEKTTAHGLPHVHHARGRLTTQHTHTHTHTPIRTNDTLWGKCIVGKMRAS